MAYELIETIEVGAGGAASIEFTSIPQDGTDLVVKVSARNSDSFSLSAVSFNGVTTDRSSVTLQGIPNSSPTSFSQSLFSIVVGDSDDTANTFGNSEFYISNYTSSSAKSISADNVNENNDIANILRITAATWDSSDAINSINISNPLGNYVIGSVFSLYKITAA